MQDLKTASKRENCPKTKNPEAYPDLFLSPFPISQKISKNKSPNNFIGKKLTGDAELISWLSGIEINNKNEKEEEGQEENNSKIKKKLRDKLINNARKCELFFKHKFENEDVICIQCAFCLKKYFNQNELIRFVNFDDFIYYLKYIFYLSDKVTCYSIINFKSNKKSFDSLFSKFKKKEEKWDFNQDKILCKLCMFKLVNKPDFMKKIKSILLQGENEKSYNINEGDIIIELDSDESKNKNYKSNFVVEKCKNNNVSRNHRIYENRNKNQKNRNNYNQRPPFPYYNYNNPNYLNIFNSNNININIKNDNQIINNYYQNNSFIELCQKVNNNEFGIQDLNTNKVNLYWHQLFYINHNKVVDICKEIKIEMINLNCYVKKLYKKMKEKAEYNLENQYRDKQIIQNSKNRTLFLLKRITYFIEVNKNCFNFFINDLGIYRNKESVEKILITLINENNKNYFNISQLLEKYDIVIKYYLEILYGNQ